MTYNALSLGYKRVQVPRQSLTRSVSAHARFGRRSPADVLESELARTQEVLSTANQQLAEERREAQRVALRREREFEQRAQAARERARAEDRALATKVAAAERAAALNEAVGAEVSPMQRVQLLTLAEQVAKQRKALEVELRSEQMRRNDRDLAEEQWAERVRDLQKQVEESLGEASRYQLAAEDMERKFGEMRDAWIESVRRANTRRGRRLRLSHAVGVWYARMAEEAAMRRAFGAGGVSVSLSRRMGKRLLTEHWGKWLLRCVRQFLTSDRTPSHASPMPRMHHSCPRTSTSCVSVDMYRARCAHRRMRKVARTTTLHARIQHTA